MLKHTIVITIVWQTCVINANKIWRLNFSQQILKLSAKKLDWAWFFSILGFQLPKVRSGNIKWKPTSTWRSDEALGQRQSSAAPFLIASLQEEELGPSAAVEKQEEETQAETSVGSPNWARKTDEDLLELIREGTQFQEDRGRVRRAGQRSTTHLSFLEEI